MNNINSKGQKYLGDKGFVVFITFLSAFIPLSTDVYLPALPAMIKNFHTTASQVNLTVVSFFIFYAIGTMFWGPLSDKYGRRRVLIIGMVLYTVASILCVFSVSVYQLILYRVMQAIGCGAATATATAIIKDVYQGHRRMKILAIVQSMGMISPIVAPIIGAFILTTFSWRGVFVVLAGVGAVTLLGSIAMEETISDSERTTGDVLASAARLGVVARNKAFFSLLVVSSVISIASMSFITGSSYIYVNGFGVSERGYSYYFAVNAIFFLIGPLIYMALSKKIRGSWFVTAGFASYIISGVLLVTIGGLQPYFFALSIIPASLMGSVMAPQRTNMMLEQLDGDTGAASSLMSCVFTFFGSIGMVLISMDFKNRVLVMGILYLVTGCISLFTWNSLQKKSYIRHGAWEEISEEINM